MGKNIGYHTRRIEDGSKVTGGSFGGSINVESVNRLVNAHFEVVVQPSGRPVFVDKQGQQVSLYLSVDPRCTEKGLAALKAFHKERAVLDKQREEERRREIEELLADLPYEEALRRLKGGA